MPLSPTQALLSAIERDDGGIAVVWCPDITLRTWLVEETRSLARPNANPLVVQTVDGALAVPDRMALLVPGDERGLVADLEGCRDQFLEPPRTQPVVVFLLRHGDGAADLQHHPSFASWVRGSDVDPEAHAAIDVPTERQRFLDENGVSVDDWLGQWRDGHHPHTGEMYARAYWAAMLVEAKVPS